MSMQDLAKFDMLHNYSTGSAVEVVAFATIHLRLMCVSKAPGCASGLIARAMLPRKRASGMLYPTKTYNDEDVASDSY